MSSERLLSVFVDESGNFGDPNDPARLCIVTLVLHDQSFDISRFVKDLDMANYDLGLDPETFQSNDRMNRSAQRYDLLIWTIRG